MNTLECILMKYISWIIIWHFLMLIEYSTKSHRRIKSPAAIVILVLPSIQAFRLLVCAKAFVSFMVLMYWNNFELWCVYNWRTFIEMKRKIEQFCCPRCSICPASWSLPLFYSVDFRFILTVFSLPYDQVVHHSL